ncbi:Uncharacterized protein At4g17910 [Linum perenne]
MDSSFSWVLNQESSSAVEILALSTFVPILFIIRHSLGFNHHQHNDSESRNLCAYMGLLSLDFMFLIVPMLLIFTVFEQQTYTWTIISAVLLLPISISKRCGASSSVTNSKASASLRASITSYRVIVMEVACLCILAVDFKIFPRRHAKSKTYGISLMDLGVGSFALANAVVSKQARGISSLSLKDASAAIVPPLAIGFGRLILTKCLHYGVPAGEYGVHWNFFFTLAALAMLASLIRIPTNYSGISGLVILIGYQWWLNTGLNSYLLANTRGTDIVSQNKEGLFSLLGKWCRFRLLTIVLDKHVERISRRMCNLAYVTLILAENLQVLAILMVSDYLSESKVSTLEEAINRNLLATFLVANVLTGLVNMIMDTNSASPILALFILVVYSFVTSFASGVAHFYGLRLKFW